MTQVASIMVPAAGAMPDARAGAEAGAGADDMAASGKFSDIFQRLGEKRSDRDSAPHGKAAKAGSEAPAAGKGKTGTTLPAAGLHRLLASGRLAAADIGGGRQASDAGEAANDDVATEAEAGDPPAMDDGAAEAIAETGSAAALSAMVSAEVPASVVPVAAAMPAPVREETRSEPKAGTKPEGKGAQGVIVVTPEADGGQVASPVRVPVTVEKFETHFAPLETVSAPVAEAATSGALPRKAEADRPANGKAVGASTPAKGAAAARPMVPPADGGDDEEMPSLAGAEKPEPAPRERVATVSEERNAGARMVAKAETTATPSAPVTALPAATLKQVGDAITGAAAEMRQAPAVPAGDVTETSPRAVVKVLTVRLDPPEYGSVAVRLTLQDGALSVQIRAERETTAQALDHDREKLAEHLKASGYGTDATMIDTRRDLAVMRSEATAGGNAGTGNNGTGSGGPAGQAPGGGAMARGGGGGTDGGSGQGFARERQGGRDDAAVPDTGARDLYV